MIQINLLPQNARKTLGGGAQASRSGGRSALLWIAIALALAANGAGGWLALRQVWQAQQECEQVKLEYDKVSKEIDQKLTEADAIRKFREVVTNQMDVLKSLDPADRILWSEKINMLSNLMPPSVFISELQVSENVEMVETEQSRVAHDKWSKLAPEKRGKEPEAVKRPRIHYLMRITGMSMGTDSADQGANMLKFHKAMTTYAISDGHGGMRRFMDAFNPNVDFESVEALTHEGQPVTKFIFKLTSKAMGEDTEKSAKPRQARQVAANIGN